MLQDPAVGSFPTPLAGDQVRGDGRLQLGGDEGGHRRRQPVQHDDGPAAGSAGSVLPTLTTRRQYERHCHFPGIATVTFPTLHISHSSRFAELVDAWLRELGTTKPAANTVAAYRRDLDGVARRIAADAEVSVLHLQHLTKDAMRGAFASWAVDHAAASVLRAHSSWSRFFDFLVTEDLVEGNPMAAVAKPRPVVAAPRAIRDPDAADRLLGVAAVADPRGRDPWPERDLALVATFCVTGIRESEAVALNLGSLEGTAGARRLQVTGKGNKTRAIPIEIGLEQVLDAYLGTRAARFPRQISNTRPRPCS